MEQDHIKKITQEINSRSGGYDLGGLQEIRKKIFRLKRLPGKNIFTKKTTSNEYAFHHGGRKELQYAFHHGGRKELQFNVGIEKKDDISKVRFGVAFSLELSQSLTSADIRDTLVPKIVFFNDYIRSHPGDFSDMRMWHCDQNNHWSEDYAPSAIPHERVTEGTFIFLGIRQPLDHIDYELALDVMNRLLPLYLYTLHTEIQGSTKKLTISKKPQPFQLRPGFTSKPSTANASYVQKQLDINLRHNVIQEALHRRLSEKYGEGNVGTESPSGNGTRIDLVVKHKTGHWFYEIKTACTAKACIREAIGQLLEYSYWPNSQEAIRLVIVGEAKMDEEAQRYIDKLKSRFNLPLYYESIEI